MKYTLQSFKYVIKNFIYLLPFAILPAILLSFSTDEEAVVHVMDAVFAKDISQWTFFMLFRAISVLNFGSWQSLVFGILGIILIVPCVALMMALLEKHFRIGRRTFNGIWSRLNDNFVSTLWYTVCLVVLYEVWALVCSAILFVLSRIDAPWIMFTLAPAVFFAMHLVLLYGIGVFYLWLPCMQMTGFRAFEALRYSNRLMAPAKWKILFAQMIFMIVTEVFICLCAIYIPNIIVFTVLTTLLYLVMLMVYCVRMQIAYFDLDHIERADLARYYGK